MFRIHQVKRKYKKRLKGTVGESERIKLQEKLKSIPKCKNLPSTHLNDTSY